MRQCLTAVVLAICCIARPKPSHLCRNIRTSSFRYHMHQSNAGELIVVAWEREAQHLGW